MRDWLAQVFFSWALKLNGKSVMLTVYDGIEKGAWKKGLTPENWRAIVRDKRA